MYPRTTHVDLRARASGGKKTNSSSPWNAVTRQLCCHQSFYQRRGERDRSHSFLSLRVADPHPTRLGRRRPPEPQQLDPPYPGQHQRQEDRPRLLVLERSQHAATSTGSRIRHRRPPRFGCSAPSTGFDSIELLHASGLEDVVQHVRVLAGSQLRLEVASAFPRVARRRHADGSTASGIGPSNSFSLSSDSSVLRARFPASIGAALRPPRTRCRRTPRTSSDFGRL